MASLFEVLSSAKNKFGRATRELLKVSIHPYTFCRTFKTGLEIFVPLTEPREARFSAYRAKGCIVESPSMHTFCPRTCSPAWLGYDTLSRISLSNNFSENFFQVYCQALFHMFRYSRCNAHGTQLFRKSGGNGLLINGGHLYANCTKARPLSTYEFCGNLLVILLCMQRNEMWKPFPTYNKCCGCAYSTTINWKLVFYKSCRI